MSNVIELKVQIVYQSRESEYPYKLPIEPMNIRDAENKLIELGYCFKNLGIMRAESA